MSGSRFRHFRQSMTSCCFVVGHEDTYDDQGKVLGEFRATGYMPSFLDEFIKRGLVKDGDFV